MSMDFGAKSTYISNYRINESQMIESILNLKKGQSILNLTGYDDRFLSLR